MGRRIAGSRDAHETAVGAHDVHRGVQVDGAELVVEALEVAPHARAHVGVHHRHQGALVLAELRQDLAGEGNRNVGAGFQNQRLEPLLVGVVGVGVHQGHGDRLHPGVEQLADRLAGLRLVERPQDSAARVAPLRDPPCVLQVRERVRLLHDHPAGERSGGLRAREVEHLLEVLGDQQTHSRALFLEHDVGRDGRTVQDGADIARAHVGAVQQGGGSVDDPDGLVLGGRRRLQEMDLATSLVEEQEVGEGSADVDAEARAHGCRARRPVPVGGVPGTGIAPLRPSTGTRAVQAPPMSIPERTLIDRRPPGRFRGTSCLA